MHDPTIPPPPVTREATAPPPLPWEDPSSGLLGGFFGTVRLLALEPQEAFNRMGAGGLGRPYFYALIAAWIETIAGFAYWFLLQAPFFLAAMPGLGRETGGAALGAGMMLAIALGVLIAMPLVVAIVLFLHGAILHLALLILGEGKGGFATTIRLLCYSHTADLAGVIPLCGGLIGVVWFVVLQVIGVAEAHRCSYGKATLAVLLPLLLCCGCVAGLIGLVAGAGFLGALAEL